MAHVVSRHIVPRWVNEANHVSKESSIDRIGDSEFSKSLNCEEQHSTDDDEAESLK
jgi:hypothetical protein